MGQFQIRESSNCFLYRYLFRDYHSGQHLRSGSRPNYNCDRVQLLRATSFWVVICERYQSVYNYRWAPLIGQQLYWILPSLIAPSCPNIHVVCRTIDKTSRCQYLQTVLQCDFWTSSFVDKQTHTYLQTQWICIFAHFSTAQSGVQGTIWTPTEDR